MTRDEFRHWIDKLEGAAWSGSSTAASREALFDEHDRLTAMLSDISGLCIGYDGFDTVDGLKSLIDDIALICSTGQPLTRIPLEPSP